MKTFTTLKIAFTSTLFLFLLTMVSFAQKATLFQNFEAQVWHSTNYNQRTVTDNLGAWTVAGVCITDDDRDRKHGERSIRFRGNAATDNHFIQMDFDKTNGIGEVSFYYASYSTHSGGQIVLYYSTNGGTSWTLAGSPLTAPAWSGAMIKASFILNISGNVRIKIAREEVKTNSSVNIDDLNLTDFVCENCVVAPVFDPPGGNQSGTINVKITSATAGATIRYTLDGNDPTESSTVYSNAIMVDKQTTIKAKAWKDGMDPSSVSTAVYNYLQSISSLAALRALAPAYTGGDNKGTAVYTYSGNAVVTQLQDYTNVGGTVVNVRYIQDNSGAIMVYDFGGNLKSDWEYGDLITGLSGTLSNYFGMLRFIPVEGDCEAFDPFNKVTPVKVMASQLNFKHDNPIQAKLITIENVTIVQPGQPGNYKSGTYYGLKQNNLVYDSVFYTDKFEADYIGDPIPTIATTITGVCNYKGATGVPTKNRIVMLDKGNDVVKITDINKSTIKLSPNPANSYVNIITESPMKLEIYSLLGNLIAVDNLSEGHNTIPVSNYPAGVYIMKMMDTSTGQSYIQKLVIK
jgi:hypothetical protein